MDDLTVTFTLANLDGTNKLYPRTDGVNNAEANWGSPALFFDRCQVFASGELIEDQLYFNRTEMLLQKMAPANAKVQDDALGLFNCPYFKPNGYVASTPSAASWIDKNDSYTCSFRPKSLGLVRSGKCWPLFASSLQFVFYLAQTSDAIDTQSGHSTSFELQNINMQISQITLDSNLQDAYNKTLMSGKSFQIAQTQFMTSFYAIAKGQTDIWIPVSRALSRLKACFATFAVNNDNNPTRFAFPDPNERDRAWTGQLSNATFKTQLQIGSMLFPERPCDSISWHYRQLLLCLGLLDQTVKTCAITAAEFRQHSFILATLLERVVGGWSSGLNIMSGSQLRYQLSGLPTSNILTGMYITMVADTIVEVSESSCSWYT